MTVAHTERLALCALLDRLGPDAPTLCTGWRTADLAAHLWVRENDPVAVPGIFAEGLATVTARRMQSVLDRWGYRDLVERLRTGPSRLSVYNLPGVDEAANAAEYFVHHEDVRRANGELEPRLLTAEAEDLLWKRVSLFGRLWFRRSPVGVVLERSDGERVTAAAGSSIVTVIGPASELLLFGFGRREPARLEFVGEPDAVAVVRRGGTA